MPPVFQRALIELSLVVRTSKGFEQVNAQIEPDSFQIQRRSHSHAASCDFAIRGGSLPFDPDHVESGFVVVFFDDVGEMTGSAQGRDNIRFLGYLDELKRDDDERGPVINGKARDLSALLRDPPPLAAHAIPRYEDTLFQALQRIVDSRIAQLAGPDGGSISDTIYIRPTDALVSASLSALVGAPHKRGPIPMPKGDCTPWQAIETVCGMAARLVTVDGQEIVVRLPSEALGEDGQHDTQKPVLHFLFGAEDAALPGATAPIVPAMKVTRARKLIRQRKGVHCVAWDAHGRRRIEAVYPEDSALPARRLPSKFTERGAALAKIKAARQAASTRATPQPGRDTHGRFVKEEGRDIFYVREVHTEARLREVAKSIYLQRSRQEMEGAIETHEIPDALLNLQNGDRITLHVAPNVEIELQSLRNDEDRISYLVARLGMEKKSAAVLLRAYSQPRQRLFYVKGVSIAYAKDATPTVNVEFLNLLTVKVAA